MVHIIVQSPQSPHFLQNAKQSLNNSWQRDFLKYLNNILQSDGIYLYKNQNNLLNNDSVKMLNNLRLNSKISVVYTKYNNVNRMPYIHNDSKIL